MSGSVRLKQAAVQFRTWISTTKKGKIFLLLMLLYIVGIIFVTHDAWLYKTPIVKVTEVQTRKERVVTSVRGDKEQYYKQSLTGVLQNGSKKGKRVHLTNEFSYSGVLNQKYYKGDQLLISLNQDFSGNIKGLKRDAYLAVLTGALLILLVMAAEVRGLLAVCTLAANLGIFIVGFSGFLAGKDIIKICNIMSVLFVVLTLIFLNGFHRKTWAAIFSTLVILALIMLIFDTVLRHTEALDYSSMEYLGSLDNPEELFRAEVMLAGLGAIMDVAVTVSAAFGEIVRKKPSVTFLQLFRSGREIGYDIMGTMMNVLLFVYGCGLIPIFLIRLNNGIGFLTIIRLHIPYEICRFLIESIGIVLTIPVSVLIAALFMKIGNRRGGKL